MKKITLTNLSSFYAKANKDEDGRSIDLYYGENMPIAFRIKDFGGGKNYVFPTVENIPAWAIVAIAGIVTDFNKFYNQINN